MWRGCDVASPQIPQTLKSSTCLLANLPPEQKGDSQEGAAMRVNGQDYDFRTKGSIDHRAVLRLTEMLEGGHNQWQLCPRMKQLHILLIWFSLLKTIMMMITKDPAFSRMKISRTFRLVSSWSNLPSSLKRKQLEYKMLEKFLLKGAGQGRKSQ